MSRKRVHILRVTFVTLLTLPDPLPAQSLGPLLVAEGGSTGQDIVSRASAAVVVETAAGAPFAATGLALDVLRSGMSWDLK